jgi:hypothetical protein
MPDSDGE